MQRRDNLKLIVTSATIDNDSVADFFAISRDYKK
jgi:HrpA-like RNA helicase